jgi:hypothetical protein
MVYSPLTLKMKRTAYEIIIRRKISKKTLRLSSCLAVRVTKKRGAREKRRKRKEKRNKKTDHVCANDLELLCILPLVPGLQGL